MAQANADKYQVFSIRTDFPMADGQASVRDVYVNMGTNQGVKVGSKLSVLRPVTTVDQINQKTGSNITFKFAKLKIIFADPEISIGRVVEFAPQDSTPIGFFTNVMTGDEVEIASK